ncbi:MAG TPA: hypothetical protein VFR61_01720 [Nitrososphaeraceae archaeon]|jgi:hypothetical protein|nr:hypothetical protein [Nitrososphaeraceae archaeon]
MADQLIMYPIVVGVFAYLTFSLFYIRKKYSKKRDRKLTEEPNGYATSNPSG